jgi:hypothetical protein
MKRVRRSYEYDDSRILKILDIDEGRKATRREEAIVEGLYFHVMLNFAATSSMRLGINDGGRPIAWVGVENAEVEFDLEDVLSDLANDALQGGGAAGDRKMLVAFKTLATRLVATMDAWILELDETPKVPESKS